MRVNLCAGVQCRLQWGQCEVQCSVEHCDTVESSGEHCGAANSSGHVILMLDYCVDEGDL